jgi:hypothetical protein
MRMGFLNRGGADNNWNSPIDLTPNKSEEQRNLMLDILGIKTHQEVVD